MEIIEPGDVYSPAQLDWSALICLPNWFFYSTLNLMNFI